MTSAPVTVPYATPAPGRRRNPIARYAHWLHTMWPAGGVEKLPASNPDGTTKIPGLYLVGDLTGIPLLKFSADSGARAVQQIVADPSFRQEAGGDGVIDLAILGAGVAGMAAALEAKKAGLRYALIEAAEPFSTIVNFPKRKPIYTYPTEMTPAGDLQFHADVKESLLDEVRQQTIAQGVEVTMARAEKVARKGKLLEVVLADGKPPVVARRVIVAIGRSGNYRKLGAPGEELNKVYNRLHDPADYDGQDVLVVGGGDSALETAIAIAKHGGRVTLAHRKPEFNRPKPENVEMVTALAGDAPVHAHVEAAAQTRTSTGMVDDGRPAEGKIRLMMSTKVKQVRDDDVTLATDGAADLTLKNDAVFAMLGREAPLDFFRRSGVPINNERTTWWWVSLIAFVLFCTWVYHWKSDTAVPFYGELPGWLTPTPDATINGIRATLGEWSSNPKNLIGTILTSASSRSFYYTLIYSVIIVVFGIRRIRRRKTPYVTWQTTTLMLVQVIPLFLLPEVVLPWMGANGLFETGFGGWIGRTFFPEQSYWRSYGFVLAWPLFIYNWFTATPIWGWLVLGVLQTFVAIPAIVYFWGKGAYCGWICSCGALAETLGDQHRHKMPHGPKWNRLNMIGQAFLAFALSLMALRILGWMHVPFAERLFVRGFVEQPLFNYKWFVDILWAGIIGYGLYFWFSGRVWCRFACPLAALMHIYARVGRFRILADKKKCISCNVCTSVCHQGIDVMSFANKGTPMADPECVRCSACVQSCPTGVLSFGQVNPRTNAVISKDPAWLAASPVLMREIHVNGKPMKV